MKVLTKKAMVFLDDRIVVIREHVLFYSKKDLGLDPRASLTGHITRVF